MSLCEYLFSFNVFKVAQRVCVYSQYFAGQRFNYELWRSVLTSDINEVFFESKKH